MVKGFRKFYYNYEERIGVLRQFRILTFLILVVIAIGVIYYLANFIETSAKKRLASDVAISTRSTLNYHLKIEDFSAPPTKTLSSRLNKIFQDNLLTTGGKQYQDSKQSIIRVKVWNRQEELIYDSNQEYGNDIHSNKKIRDAFENKISANYAKDRGQVKSRGKDLVEIYIPIFLKESIDPVGVLEIYLISGSIRSFTNRTILVISTIMLLGLIFLYFTLSWLFSRASQKIHDKNEKLQQLTNKVMVTLKEVENAYLENMQALTLAVDAKDHYTAGHSLRVASFTVQIGKELGLSKSALRNIERGAKSHDIGKVGIKDSILNKPGDLTKEEYGEVKQHPVIGAKILGSIEFFREVVPIVRWHHERLDGSGYPDRMKNINLPIGPRIVAVADVFDAMTTNRPNRKALSVDTAFKELLKGAGKLYDKDVVKALIKAYHDTTYRYSKEKNSKSPKTYAYNINLRNKHRKDTAVLNISKTPDKDKKHKKISKKRPA